MKVYKSCYRNHWISPYTIIDYAFFWTDWSKCSRSKGLVDDMEWVDCPKWVDKAVDYVKPISRAIQSVLDFIHPKIDYVKVDQWDTWSMDSTLAPIILPLLKQLKEQKCGHGWVEDADVPDNLKSTAEGVTKEENCWDSNAEDRYDYIIDEMIFAFECLVDDSWEDKFRSGEMDIVWETCEDNSKLKRMCPGPNHTYKCDYEGMKVVQARISNGLRLFGVYFQTLWT